MTTTRNPIAHHDEGLAADLPRLLGDLGPRTPFLGRRQLIRGFVGGAGALAFLAACGSDSSGAPVSTSAETNGTVAPSVDTTSAASEIEASAGAEIPDETAGPYPGDGTNGPNALAESGIVRNDIRTSIGSSSGTAEGVATSVDLTVVDAETGDPLPGAAVYLWHCDREGRYSMYDIVGENYLRGVQIADGDGRISFTTVFPGCYAGRWPHAHFEVYATVDEATVGTQAVKTSQIAFPETACNEVYATSGYEASVQNLSRTSLTSDNVFSDGVDDQLAAVTGSPGAGYSASLLVRV